MIGTGVIDRKEGIANADSSTNLMWRLQNDFNARTRPDEHLDDADDEPTFTEISLDVKH